jgi:hypothetical protein
MTEDDLKVIDIIRDCANKHGLEIEDEMDKTIFIGRMFGIERSKTYRAFDEVTECTESLIDLVAIANFLRFATEKFQNDQMILGALSFELLMKLFTVTAGTDFATIQKYHQMYQAMHGQILNFLGEFPPVFIFTDSDNRLEEMLSVVFKNDSKVDDVYIVLNDLTVNIARSIQKAKTLAKSDNQQIDHIKLNCYTSKHTIFYNILASKSGENFIGLLFVENECVQLSDLGKDLIYKQMNVGKFKHEGSPKWLEQVSNWAND